MRVILMASGDLWAGAEVMVYQLATGLNKILELDLLVILLNKGRLADELQKSGIEVLLVEETECSFVTLFRTVRKLVAEFSPDIIHSHRYKENLLAWFSIFGRRSANLIATQHGMPEEVGCHISLRSRIGTGLFFRLLSSCFDCTVLVSKEMWSLLLGSYGFSKKNLTVIHNGVSIPAGVNRRSGDRLVVGSAGRFFPVKDFGLFVEIAHFVTKQNGMVDFVIAGDGPQHAMMEEKVRLYGLQERFRFLGHQEDMDTFYRSLDVYINTSVHEGIPMSVLEAMSYSLPAIVPKVGGFPEIIENGESGFLVEGRDPAAFGKKILELLQDDRRGSMAKSARRRVEGSFSQESMVNSYLRHYREVLST